MSLKLKKPSWKRRPPVKITSFCKVLFDLGTAGLNYQISTQMENYKLKVLGMLTEWCKN
jgi:hypothetical protein